MLFSFSIQPLHDNVLYRQFTVNVPIGIAFCACSILSCIQAEIHAEVFWIELSIRQVCQLLVIFAFLIHHCTTERAARLLHVYFFVAVWTGTFSCVEETWNCCWIFIFLMDPVCMYFFVLCHMNIPFFKRALAALQVLILLQSAHASAVIWQRYRYPPAYWNASIIWWCVYRIEILYN